MKTILVRIYFSLLVILVSCGAPGASDANYVAWVRDYKNGMHVTHQQNDLKFDLQYQPSEYVWMQRNGKFDQDAFERQRAELDQLQCFTLNIYSGDGKKDVIAYRAKGDRDRANELLYYFSYRFQEAISVDDGSAKMPCILFHFEQHGTQSFVLGFEKGQVPVNDVTLTIVSPILDINPIKIKVATDPKVL